MFYIDDYNREDMPFEQAKRIVMGGNGNLLDSMSKMKERLLSLQDQDDFYDDWCYEINAYNKIFSEMKKLFN